MNLLIVDDEKIILDGISNKKNWTDLEIDSVFIASDVSEAINIVQTENIDIVITDISMPGESGLLLCKKISVDYPHTYLIILSGYDNFTYAQEAIEFGVKEYLLKPATIEKIHSAVERAIIYQKKIYDDKIKLDEIQNELHTNNNILRSYWLIELLLGTDTLFYSDKELIEEMRLNIPVNGNSFAFVSIKEINDVEMWGKNSESIVAYAILNISEEILGKYYDDFIITGDLSNNIVILYHGIDTHKWVEELKSVIEKNIGVTIDIIINDDVSVFELKSIYNKIKKEHNISNENYSLQGIGGNNKNIITGFANNLIESVSCGNIQSSTEIINNMFDTLDEGGTEYMCSICVVFILDLIYKNNFEYNNQIANSHKLYAIITELRNSKNNKQLKDRFMKFILSICSAEKNDVIMNVKRYICEHIKEEINLQQVAAVAFMSPNYFSNFFRKETGVTFSDYVAELKIEKAKELLRYKNYKVINVASEIGFKDQRYFSSFFKKHEGINPTEYRNKFFNGDVDEN